MLAGVEAGLLVGAGEEGVLGLLVGDKGGDELKLETLGDVVLELDVVAEHIGGAPCLGEGNTVLAVLPLGLKVAVDRGSLGVTQAEHTEGDVVRGTRLNLEGGAVDGEVLSEQVGCGLAKVL